MELGLVGVIADVAGVEHGHGKLAPFAFVGLEFAGVELVVEKAALTADEVGVEVVGLEAIDDGGALADGSVFELQDGDGGGVVLVGSEDVAARLGGHAGDRLDLAAHAHEEGVEGVATGGEEGAAAVLLADVPAKLAVPGADAMVVIDLAVVEVAKQAFIDGGLGDEELAGETALEADAAFHPIGGGGSGDLADFLERVGHRLLKDDVLLRVGRGDGLVAVIAGIGGDVDNVDVGIGQHFIEVLVGLDGGAVLGAELVVGQRAGGIDRCDLGLSGGVDGRDVGTGCPSMSDDSDVVFFHAEKESTKLGRFCQCIG